MTFDMFESKALDNVESFDLKGRMSSLRSGFDSSLKSNYDAYIDMPDSIDSNLCRWLGLGSAALAMDLAEIKIDSMDSVKQMYRGLDLGDGKYTLGLKEINNWNIHPVHASQNIKQHVGFAAEVIGTAKDNMLAKLDNTEFTTFRADDVPDRLPVCDKYVDKVRFDTNGNVVERIHVKFVGRDAESCLEKLTSHKLDNCFKDGFVDKIEIPKDYYDGVKEMIPDKVKVLEEQLAKVKEKGDSEVIKAKEAQIERYNKIDQMLLKSTVSSHEAVEAVKHPKRYVAKRFVRDTFAEHYKENMDSPAFGLTVITAVSTIDNVSKVMDGEITAKNAFINVAKETGKAGMEYGVIFVSTTVENSMADSTEQLLQSLFDSDIPQAAISIGIESYDSIIDYAEGTIDGKQLAYDLGDNVAGEVGDLVGGTVGTAVASVAYASAVEYGSENAGVLADKAQEMANHTVDIAKEVAPDSINNVVNSLNRYATLNNIPFKVQC